MVALVLRCRKAHSPEDMHACLVGTSPVLLQTGSRETDMKPSAERGRLSQACQGARTNAEPSEPRHRDVTTTNTLPTYDDDDDD